MFTSKKKKSRSPSADSGTGFRAWMGNLGVFYLTLLGMISIPFLVLFVILFIRTIMDYHVWILLGVAAVITVTLSLLIRHRKQIRKQFEEEKKDVMEIIRTAAREGHDVNISFMRGLINLDYQGSKNDGRLLEGSTQGQIKALPMSTAKNKPEEVAVFDSESWSRVVTPRISSELEKLSGLLEQGLLTKAEFQELKERLIEREK